MQYRIEDPVRYLFRVRESRQMIRDVAEAVMRRVVGNRPGSDVLTVGRVAASTKVRSEMQKILNACETGVRPLTVELQDVTPPEPVKPAFDEVDETRQGRERTIGLGPVRRVDRDQTTLLPLLRLESGQVPVAGVFGSCRTLEDGEQAVIAQGAATQLSGPAT